MTRRKETPTQFIWANSAGRLGVKDLLLKGAERSLEKLHWHGGQRKEKRELALLRDLVVTNLGLQREGIRQTFLIFPAENANEGL